MAVKERRSSRRRKVSLKAQRISGGEKQGMLIENISEHGIRVVTNPSHTMARLVPGERVDIGLELPSGDSVTLHCTVRWAHEKVPPEEASSVGIEILDPPEKYVRFVKSLP
jgi:hypothetical protein